MNLLRCLFESSPAARQAGLWLRLRQAFPRPLAMWRAWQVVDSTGYQPEVDRAIVVVGLGTAALSCLKELKARGFRNLTLVAADSLYGGKCVNVGCMPFEFVLSRVEMDAPQIRADLNTFVEGLREDVRQQFLQLDVPMLQGLVQRVEGRCLHFSDGRSLEFDGLVLALGNQFDVPASLDAFRAQARLEDLTALPQGSRLCIHGDGNPTVLGVADFALKLGLKPVILMSGRNPLAELPAYRYFVRELVKAGAQVFEEVSLRGVTEQGIAFKSKSKSLELDVDHLLCLSKPVPRFIEVDGRLPQLFDIDLRRASEPRRPDIVYLGDGGGMLTASEAELQGKMLARAWANSQAMDLQSMESLPISIHGTKPLVMMGPPWSLREKQWREIDFRTLGWTKIHGCEGKLWYLLNEASGHIQAVHMCHRDARELVALVAALLPYAVDDLRWQVGGVHPSAAEIFKVMADDALARCAGLLGQGQRAESGAHGFRLPDLAAFDNLSLPDWLDTQKWHNVVLSNTPNILAATYFGMSKFCELTGCKIDINFLPETGRAECLTDLGKVIVSVNRGMRSVNLDHTNVHIAVFYE